MIFCWLYIIWRFQMGVLNTAISLFPQQMENGFIFFHFNHGSQSFTLTTLRSFLVHFKGTYHYKCKQRNRLTILKVFMVLFRYWYLQLMYFGCMLFVFVCFEYWMDPLTGLGERGWHEGKPCLGRVYLRLLLSVETGHLQWWSSNAIKHSNVAALNFQIFPILKYFMTR